MSMTFLITIGLLLVAGGFVLGVMVAMLFLGRSHPESDSQSVEPVERVDPEGAGVFPPPPPTVVSSQPVAAPPPPAMVAQGRPEAVPQPPVPQYVPQVPPPPAPPRQQPAAAGKGKTGTEPEKPISMVAQIDDILQEIITGTPLEARGIRLAEDLHHNAVVWVGKDHFDGIGSVTDPEARAALQKAAAEYERRMERSRQG
jgi:type IV secretory pathway VirB10-like protein